MNKENKDLTISIESAIAGGSLSLYKKNIENFVNIKTVSSNGDRSRAEDIVPLIASLLEDQGSDIADLSRIIVSAGPGSYTGIRIGIATALGIADSRGIPLSKISLLAAIAFSSGNERSATIVPVGRGTMCVQAFDNDAKVQKLLSPPISVSSVEDGLAAVKDIDDSLTLFAADYGSDNIMHESVRVIAKKPSECLAAAAFSGMVPVTNDLLFIAKPETI